MYEFTLQHDRTLAPVGKGLLPRFPSRCCPSGTKGPPFSPGSGHACIFWISNPKGQTTCFASYVVVGNSLPFESIFFMIFNNCPNVVSDVPFFAFHCSNSSVVPTFFCPSSAVGYSDFLWSSNMRSNLAFSFSLSHSLCASRMASPKASSPRSSSAAISSSLSPLLQHYRSHHTEQ